MRGCVTHHVDRDSLGSLFPSSAFITSIEYNSHKLKFEVSIRENHVFHYQPTNKNSRLKKEGVYSYGEFYFQEGLVARSPKSERYEKLSGAKALLSFLSPFLLSQRFFSK